MQILFKVSILNGIVMGGGAGTSIHGRFRVATENSVYFFRQLKLSTLLLGFLLLFFYICSKQKRKKRNLSHTNILCSEYSVDSI